MNNLFRDGLIAVALLSVVTPAIARQSKPQHSSKEQAHERMLAIVQELEVLRATNAPGSGRMIQQLFAELEVISASLGGDLPARSGPATQQAVSTSGSQLLVAPTCGGVGTSNASFPGTNGAIVPAFNSFAAFTTSVSGMGAYLWDIQLNTTITHTDNDDIEMRLTSPSGTTVTITTDEGGANDNVYNGTTWTESVNDTVMDHTFANNVAATPLNAEGRLAAFRGEDPNGVWTLTIVDDLVADVGTLNGWSLDISTLAAPPSESTANFTVSPGLAISSSGTPLVTSTLAVAGTGNYLSKLTLFLQIPHAQGDNLDITLTSPLGTTVKVTTDNSGTLDNTFNGTLFTADSTDPVTDHVYVNNVTVAVLSPEGAFDLFLGQDPNGVWTLNVQDDVTANGGTLVRWDLDVTTTTPPSPSGFANFAGTSGAIPDQALIVTPTVYTTFVSGTGTNLWDVDLTTFITHTSNADVDMTLTSPLGTVIVITSDNGGTDDDVYNGTTWDDNALVTVDGHTYVDATLASPLAPEGRLSAFRGEDPNGTWTLTITDDAAVDAGSLTGWSLDLATLPTVPGSVTTTQSQSPALPIPVGAPTATIGSQVDTMVFAAPGTQILEVELFLQIAHTFPGDLDITLVSPAGTSVVVTTDNAVSNDHVFNGTLFDPSSSDGVTEHVYTLGVVAPLLSPEGGFDAFLGQDPNGLWTLNIVDDFTIDSGTLHSWALTVRTCPGNGNAFCTNGSLGIDHATGCPCGNTGAPGNGCGHSFDSNGANMDASGSVAADTVVLHSSFEPVSSFTLFMQHANAGDTIFHDGVLCAANPLIRLRGRSAVAGEAFFPNSNFAQDSTTTLSIRGGTFPGSGATMRYAAWYRNASSTFCPPATANVTNGWQITW